MLNKYLQMPSLSITLGAAEILTHDQRRSVCDDHSFRVYLLYAGPPGRFGVSQCRDTRTVVTDLGPDA